MADEISAPKDFQHVVHVDKDFNWSIEDGTDVSEIFREVRMIGEGGFGSVYEMEHIPSGIHMAGKMILPENVTKQTKKALAAEVNLLKQIKSPFTVQYYGSIMWKGNPMILMEFCNRGSLRDIMDAKKIKFSENQISMIMHDVLLALTLLHNKYHILHRDIKAANILINSDGRVMLTDFGISRQFDAQKPTMQTQTCIGTPCWMAPEILNASKYTFPADVWSVGITAVELFEGFPPFHELSPTRALVEISVNGFPGFRKGAKLTHDFFDFIRKCTDKNPNTRPKVDDLLQHPFIKRADTIRRENLFGKLVKDPIDFQALLDEIVEDEEPNKEETQQETTTEAFGTIKSGTLNDFLNDDDDEEDEEPLNGSGNESTDDLLSQYTMDVEFVETPIPSEFEVSGPPLLITKLNPVQLGLIILVLLVLLRLISR